MSRSSPASFPNVGAGAGNPAGPDYVWKTPFDNIASGAGTGENGVCESALTGKVECMLWISTRFPLTESKRNFRNRTWHKSWNWRTVSCFRAVMPSLETLAVTEDTFDKQGKMKFSFSLITRTHVLSIHIRESSTQWDKGFIPYKEFHYNIYIDNTLVWCHYETFKAQRLIGISLACVELINNGFWWAEVIGSVTL